MAYERHNIRALDAYVPGEQPEDQRVVKLNTNENPYPPLEQIVRAVRGVDPDALRRYPPPDAGRFRQVAAQAHQLTPGHVIATNGGDELLRLAITVFCQPGPGQDKAGGLGIAQPSYSLYPVLAQIHDTALTEIPLGEDFQLPDDFSRQLNARRCRLAIIVNPHAPSGRAEPPQKLVRLARDFDGVLLIDEAYVDFAQLDALELLDPRHKLDNVLILRTLSKGYSLAGLRFGYGLGSPGLIAALHKARDSYNTDILSQAAAVAALEHRAEVSQICQRVIQERERLTRSLRKLGFGVLPSQANFILAQPPGSGPDAASIYQSLKQQGVFVRYFDQERLRDKLRITIGTPQQNDTLLRALEGITAGEPQP